MTVRRFSKTDPKHYRNFKYLEDVERAGFEPTGMIFGGIYSPRQWERLVEAIPFMRSFEAIQGNDPPGAMDEAMRHIRENRTVIGIRSKFEWHA